MDGPNSRCHQGPRPAKFSRADLFWNEKQRMGHSEIERSITGTGERRAAVRVVYETVAMIAEYDGENFPLFSAFWEVQTIDLSATGIGFWSYRRPATQLLLLMLGNPQAHPIFIVSRVAHCVAADEGGKFKVGCELLKRLDA